ncbi:MAG: hypothetical protein RQ736_00010 [Thiogranum sp.]|nr:hypothetical protein [Thiogranum sp.]
MSTITPGTEYSSGTSDEVREHRAGFLIFSGWTSIAMSTAARRNA